MTFSLLKINHLILTTYLNFDILGNQLKKKIMQRYFRYPVGRPVPGIYSKIGAFLYQAKLLKIKKIKGTPFLRHDFSFLQTRRLFGNHPDCPARPGMRARLHTTTRNTFIFPVSYFKAITVIEPPH
jgi:hypothetical protein